MGDVDAAELNYHQTEPGAFSSSIETVALTGDKSPIGTKGEEIHSPAAQLLASSASKPAIYMSRQIYRRRLHVTGSAPRKFLLFAVPMGSKAAIRHKGQTVEPGQFLALAAGEEIDSVTTSDADFLNLRVDADKVHAILSALARADAKPLSSVLVPNGAALRAFKSLSSNYWFKPVSGGSGFDMAALKALELDTLNSLAEVLDVSVVAQFKPGLRHRRVIARVARDYLEVNLGRPVTITELYEPTSSTRRTLHYAFTSYFDASPAAYRKYRRLQAARDDLRRFHATEASVTEIALARGFWHPGRFAVDYNALFAETPSETLSTSS